MTQQNPVAQCEQVVFSFQHSCQHQQPPIMALEENILSGASFEEFDTSVGLITKIFNNFQKATNKIFHINLDTEETITYAQLSNDSIRIASALQSLGASFGKIMAIVGENSLELFNVYFGTLFTGALPGCLNPTLTAGELSQLLNLLRPDFIFCTKESFEKVKLALKNLKSNPLVIVADGTDQYFNYYDLLTHDPNDFKLPTLPSWDEHIIAILFSSGTTGLPKGVLVKDRSLQFLMRVVSLEETIRLTPFPICTGSTLILVISVAKDLGTLLYGGKTTTALINGMKKFKPNFWFNSPSNLLRLAQDPNITAEDFSSVEFMLSSGAGLTREQTIYLNEKLFKNRIGILSSYNCSETLCITNWPSDSDLINSPKIGSVGIMHPYVHLKVVHIESGDILGAGHEGEIFVKTPFVMAGYINCPKETADVLDSDGWYRTGDVGYYDTDGYVYISGRVKEIFKSMNRQVSPMQLEAIIQEHSAVFEAAVTGKPHPIDGCQPIAFVVLKKNATQVDPNDILKFVNDQVADYRKLHGGVYFVDEIPKNMSGKKMRSVLLKNFASMLSKN